jgi:altronate hydrolase
LTPVSTSCEDVLMDMTAPGKPCVLRVDPRDDVAVALVDLEAGATLGIDGTDGAPLRAQERVARGHKIALVECPVGLPVRKYGWPIGRATQPIAAGAWVHEHNLASALDGLLPAPGAWPETRATAPPEAGRDGPASAAGPGIGAARFEGYVRADGRVGTRNEIWVIATVGCVARTVERIAREGQRRAAARVDGVHAFSHPLGCSQLGGDLAATRSLLAALASHPNAGGVLLVGLGCESNQLAALLAALPGLDRRRVRAFNAQQQADEYEAGFDAVEELIAVAATDRRESRPVADLRIGLKCGGSDGFSGLTANPLLGRVTDAISAAGGSALLTEVPEIFGAEAVLAARAADAATAAAFTRLVNEFRSDFIAQGQPLDANPSPGNRAGGITTLEEKSLGAIQKAGRATLTHVVPYAGSASERGLGVLAAPGNDAVSTSALAAAGCTLVLFTTGRGTPLGCPVPTLKIASNSTLARAKPAWIDFDAGPILDGEDAAALAAHLLELVLATASGRPARNELNDERSLAIWKRGVTL